MLLSPIGFELFHLSLPQAELLFPILHFFPFQFLPLSQFILQCPYPLTLVLNICLYFLVGLFEADPHSPKLVLEDLFFLPELEDEVPLLGRVGVVLL